MSSTDSSSFSLFRELDAPFIGYSAATTPYVWNTVDLTVQWSWELMIPIPVPGCTITYEFETDGYDIKFGINFVPENQGSVQNLRPMQRAQSHVDPVAGSCVVPQRGTAWLVWDNSYSWFTPKPLCYSVTMTLPANDAAENQRATRARVALAATLEDIQRGTLRLQRAEHVSDTLCLFH